MQATAVDRAASGRTTDSRRDRPTAPPCRSTRSARSLAVWAAAALPMGVLAWIVAPWLSDQLGGRDPFIEALLICFTAGLIWHARAGPDPGPAGAGRPAWSRVRDALWLRAPQRPEDRDAWAARSGGGCFPSLLLSAAVNALPIDPAGPCPGISPSSSTPTAPSTSSAATGAGSRCSWRLPSWPRWSRSCSSGGCCCRACAPPSERRDCRRQRRALHALPPAPAVEHAGHADRRHRQPGLSHAALPEHLDGAHHAHHSELRDHRRRPQPRPRLGQPKGQLMQAVSKTVVAPAVTAPAVALRDVRKVHGQGDGAVVALDGVSVELSRGSFTAIMGPSGSGKSTFLHVAAGLDRPTSGTVALGGHRARGAQRAAADDPAARADRVRLPGLQPDALAHGHPEHRPAAAPRRSPPAALGGARGRGAGRARRAPAPPSLPALRRPAAARRDRPGARHPARGRVRRRADRSAGHPHRARRARAPARGRRRGRPHGRDGHPRPRRGGARRPRHPARRRADRRDARGARAPTRSPSSSRTWGAEPCFVSPSSAPAAASAPSPAPWSR